MKNLKVAENKVNGQVEIITHNPGRTTVAIIYNSRGDRFDANNTAKLFVNATELKNQLEKAFTLLQASYNKGSKPNYTDLREIQIVLDNVNLSNRIG